MKTLFTLCFLSLSIISYSQTYVKSNIVGNWKVVKCELFLENSLVKTSFLNISEQTDTVITGQNIGPINANLDFMIKSMIGSIMVFKEDNYCSWDIKISDLGFTNKYYVISKLNEINIGEIKNNKVDLSFMQLKINTLENDNAIFITQDSGMEFRYYVVKQK